MEAREATYDGIGPATPPRGPRRRGGVRQARLSRLPHAPVADDPRLIDPALDVVRP